MFFEQLDTTMSRKVLGQPSNELPSEGVALNTSNTLVNYNDLASIKTLVTKSNPLLVAHDLDTVSLKITTRMSVAKSPKDQRFRRSVCAKPLVLVNSVANVLFVTLRWPSQELWITSAIQRCCVMREHDDASLELGGSYFMNGACEPVK